MKKLSYWIKERHNPQLGVYYVPMGQMTVKDARAYERPGGYGDDYMWRFPNEAEYNARLAALRAKGESVQ